MSPEIIEHLKAIVVSDNIDIVLPTGFDSLKFISHFYDQISKFVKVIPVAALETIKTLGDKYEFAKFCEHNNIPHPKTYLLSDINQIKTNQVPVKYPLLTKPLLMSANKGIIKFDDPESLLKYLSVANADQSNALPLLLQEYIPGHVIDFNGFADNGHLCAWTIQQFISIARQGSDPLRWIQFLKNDTVFDIGRQIVQKTNYSGPINMDLMIDERSGRVVTIEVNPRFWANTYVSICDGVNFPDAAIQYTFDHSYIKQPRYSNCIWGSPHYLPYLILKNRTKKYLDYASHHKLYQIRYFILNRYFHLVGRLRSKFAQSFGFSINKLAYSFKKKIREASLYRKNYGVKSLIVKIVLKACPLFIYYETILYHLDLRPAAGHNINADVKVTMDQLKAADYQAMIGIKKPDNPKFLEERMSNGEQCFVAKYNEHICCYIWIAPGERFVEHESCRIEVLKDQAYIHDCYTVDQYRGKNIFPHLLSRVCGLLKEKGFTQAVAVVYNDNYPSRQSFEKLKFQKTELIQHFVTRVFNIKFHISKRLKGNSSVL